MKLPNLILLISLAFFVFLAGYAISIWVPAQDLFTQDNKSTTISVIFESISGDTLFVSSSDNQSQILEFELYKDVQVKRLVQNKEGKVRVESITLESLNRGDNVMITTIVLRNNMKQVTNIDKVVKEL